MELEKDIQKQLALLLAEPQKVSSQDASMLKDLVQLYPYYQPLHLLLAKASMASVEENNTLATAALYTNGQLLHQFLHYSDPYSGLNFNIIESESINEGERAAFEEEETFDEIGEVDINNFKFPEHKITEQDKEKGNAEELINEDDPASQIETIEDDFFAFEKSFSSEEVLSDEENPVEAINELKPDQETSELSNYNDDKLPYTFLWWLAKTRKEHQAIFQPYASPRKNNPNELQQQYVEHIFHIQSPFNAEEVLNDLPVHAESKSLGIIDNFIKNEPQISIPKPEQINNENKAKKSAEDHNDLVSETLAKIYIEQMLYHKAIDTYKKLSLKFPEKSRYFVDLIQSLEKKL